MATTKYGLGNVSVGTTGWNGILDNNMDIIDLNMFARFSATAGEIIDPYDAVAFEYGTGEVILAATGGSSNKKPCVGLSLSYVGEGETVIVQRVGYIENAIWSWEVGKRVYLGSTLGTLTQTRPATDIQEIGIATSETKIFLTGNTVLLNEALYTTTTTTTTTTSV